MAKRIVVSARGNKIDFDALKKSQPSAVPIVTGKKKVATKTAPKQITVSTRTPNIKATVPSPIPTVLPVEVSIQAEEPVVTKKTRTKDSD